MAGIAMKTGIYVTCLVCHRQKKPRGRSAPMGMSMCEDSSIFNPHGCDGYAQEPRVGDLWPRETEEDFGYPCSDEGTINA